MKTYKFEIFPIIFKKDLKEHQESIKDFVKRLENRESPVRGLCMIKRKAKKMLKRFFTLKSLSSNGRTVFFQDINISSILIRLTLNPSGFSLPPPGETRFLKSSS